MLAKLPSSSPSLACAASELNPGIVRMQRRLPPPPPTPLIAADSNDIFVDDPDSRWVVNRTDEACDARCTTRGGFGSRSSRR